MKAIQKQVFTQESSDVLSAAEETVLAELRVMVAVLRDRGSRVGLVSLGDAIAVAGGTPFEARSGAAGKLFMLKDAHFSLQECPLPADGLMVNFIRKVSR